MTQVQYSMQPQPNLCAASRSWMKLLFCKMSCADTAAAAKTTSKVAVAHAAVMAPFFLRLKCDSDPFLLRRRGHLQPNIWFIYTKARRRSKRRACGEQNRGRWCKQFHTVHYRFVQRCSSPFVRCLALLRVIHGKLLFPWEPYFRSLWPSRIHPSLGLRPRPHRMPKTDGAPWPTWGPPPLAPPPLPSPPPPPSPPSPPFRPSASIERPNAHLKESIINLFNDPFVYFKIFSVDMFSLFVVRQIFVQLKICFVLFNFTIVQAVFVHGKWDHQKRLES